MTNKELEDLYRQYYQVLYAYAYSLCQNHYLAQDLTSDTFLKALLTLKDTVPIKFWLFRVCKNLYLDGLKKSTRMLETETLTDHSTPLDELLLSEERKALYQAMLKLNPTYREVLILYYFSGFTIEEIAREHSQSYGAVKTLLSRARSRLRSVMEES